MMHLSPPLLVFTFLLAPGALAVSDGIFGRTGEQTDASGNPLSCGQCHAGGNAPAPLVVVDGLAPVYDLGGIASFVVRVQRQTGSDGVKAGFNLATTGAGIFLGSDVEQTRVNSANVDNELTHGPNRANGPGPEDDDRAPEAFGADGVVDEASWAVELTDLREGRRPHGGGRPGRARGAAVCRLRSRGSGRRGRRPGVRWRRRARAV